MNIDNERERSRHGLPVERPVVRADVALEHRRLQRRVGDGDGAVGGEVLTATRAGVCGGEFHTRMIAPALTARQVNRSNTMAHPQVREYPDVRTTRRAIVAVWRDIFGDAHAAPGIAEA